MAITVSDVLRITSVLTGPYGQFQNVFQFQVLTLPLGSDVLVMEDIAEMLEGVFSGLVSYTPASTTFLEVRGFNDTDGEPLPTVSWPALTVGAGGNGAPPGVAALAVLRTGFNRVLGRKYFGPLTVGGLTATGTISPTLNNVMVAAFGVLLTPLTGTATGINLLPGVQATVGGFKYFTEVVVRDACGYQRRRREARGV